MDTMKLTIINNSSLSGIPDELMTLLEVHTLNEANEYLETHSLKISEYDKIMNAGHLIEQKIIIVDK